MQVPPNAEVLETIRIHTNDEFAPCLAWWNKRKENERAWKVSAKELLATNWNLDRKNPKNPKVKEDITHLPPAELAASILEKEARIAEIMKNIQTRLETHGK